MMKGIIQKIAYAFRFWRWKRQGRRLIKQVQREYESVSISIPSPTRHYLQRAAELCDIPGPRWGESNAEARDRILARMHSKMSACTPSVVYVGRICPGCGLHISNGGLGLRCDWCGWVEKGDICTECKQSGVEKMCKSGNYKCPNYKG